MKTINMPGFSAEVTLYRTRNRYRSSGSALDSAISAQSVVPALTFEDTENCTRCENKCNDQGAQCAGYAVGTWLLALASCAATGPGYPICASAASSAYALAEAACAGKTAACNAICNAPGESCCPVFCGPGHCCSTGETCFLDGCCPSDRQVCGGECCAQGASCCVGACCGPEDHCCGNACCPANVPCGADGFCAGFGHGPPPPPPDNGCYLFAGGSPCGKKCCYGGLQCCSYSDEFGPDCRTSCIH